jgi:hypothetical protein
MTCSHLAPVLRLLASDLTYLPTFLSYVKLLLFNVCRAIPCYSTLRRSQSLPILWDLSGETCREIAKQTAGVSMQDTDIKQQLETLVTTWGRLSLSVLGDCNCSAPAPTPCTSSPFVPISAPCPCSDPKNPGAPDACVLSPSSTPCPVPTSPSTHTPSKKAKARAKAKARNKSKHDATLVEPSVADIQDHLRNSATSRDWLMLSSSLPPSSSTSRPTSEGLQKDGEERVGSGWSDPVAALRCIHGIVAPIVLRDTAHLDRLHQLKTALSLTVAGRGGRTADVEGSCAEEDGCPSCPALAITTSVVCVVGGDKGSQDELQVNLLMTYCFLCAALMHHLKAVGGIKHRTQEQEDGTGDR